MASTVLYMSVSLDGFIEGTPDMPDHGFGRLHEWVFRDERPQGINGQIWDEMLSTGAVVAGRGTVEPANYWNGDHHDGVPIFILSRTRTESEYPDVAFVDDVVDLMTRAEEAAGDKNVLVHGVTVARLALAAAVLDEIELHVIPVLLGRGRRLFVENDEQIELERTRVLEGEGVTHARYRVIK
jgi:dihydrofolate reductase